MSNLNDTTHAEPVRDRMIRKPRGNGEYFYWRCPGGNAGTEWVGQRSLGTRFTADEVATLRNIPPADLPHIRVVRLKPKQKPGMTLKYKITVGPMDEAGIAKAVRAEIERIKATADKAAPPVEPTSYVRTLPKVTVYALITDASATDAFIQIPADVPRLVPGERVILGGHTLVVVNTNGMVAWCSSHPQEPHGL